MEVVRQPEGGETAPPFHHILTEQAKSLIALQELQNEVGALLEFREVVMEAFPGLRAKVRAAAGSGTGRWEPGVRIRRKPRQEEPRSRSNSRSSKTTTTAGGSCSVVVADSGFCQQTSAKPSDGEPCEEDELWTLLELIQAKGTHLRLEAETLRSRSLLSSSLTPDRLHVLIQERESLSSRLSEIEAENAARAEEATRLSQQIDDLTEEKRRLEAALAATGSSTPRLGTLDGIVSSPTERIPCSGGVSPSPEVTGAILRETNVLELQRHLITISYQNQVLEKRLEKIGRAKINIHRQYDKIKEENEDLRFQLEEKSIELEGTRARVRILERGTGDCDNSSTESAGQSGETPKRPRSRIPHLKSSGKPPRPPPLSQNRKGSPAQRKNGGGGSVHGGVEHDSLEICELDRSLDSELVGPQKYFDSIESKVDSDSLDLV